MAELHVADATGLPVRLGRHPVGFTPVGRGAWALAVLEAWRPLIEGMVAGQAGRCPRFRPGRARPGRGRG